MMKIKVIRCIFICLMVCFMVSGCASSDVHNQIKETKNIARVTGRVVETQSVSKESFSVVSVPEYSGQAYVEINNNNPYFAEDEITNLSYESYSEQDDLSRCGTAVASIGNDIMPDEERGKIGMIKPTGWHSVKYDWVDGKYLYNRCHLIGYQLTGENANEKNLITGTRFLNIEGMLPFENMVADYVKETGNHVMYRVTPVFKDSELVARGIQIEGLSVEDNGEGICFNIYCYNVQPGVVIDYLTGKSHAVDLNGSATEEFNYSTASIVQTDYILNLNTHVFHIPECSSVLKMSEANKKAYTGYESKLINKGYRPCGNCITN